MDAGIAADRFGLDGITLGWFGENMVSKIREGEMTIYTFLG